jgi:hypothetical protein
MGGGGLDGKASRQSAQSVIHLSIGAGAVHQVCQAQRVFDVINKASGGGLDPAAELIEA